MWALSSAAGLSKSGPYSEAEIPSVATSRQAGTFQSLLALPSLLNGVSHYRGAFYSFCLLRRASPTPCLTPCRPSGPILERQARGEEGGTCWKSSTHEVSGCDLLLSRHSNSHLLSTHLQFWWHDLTCHLHLVSAAVRHQPANVVCDFDYTNNDLRSYLLEKSSCSQA